VKDISIVTREYLQGSDARTMQLATVDADGPWVASVYFVADDDMNLYWLSWPDRRHSAAIGQGAEVAAAVVIKADQPVVGVQLAVRAQEVSDPLVVREITEKYIAKYQQGEQFYPAFLAGTNRHKMYRLSPTRIQLFDELHYADSSPLLIDGQQEVVR